MKNLLFSLLFLAGLSFPQILSAQADTAAAHPLIREATRLMNERKFKEALDTLEAAGDIFLRVKQRESAGFATVKHKLGNVRYEQGLYLLAIPHYDEAIEIRRKVFGDRHPQVAGSLANKGNCYGQLDEYEAAVRTLQQVLEIRLEALGENHPDISRSYRSLGIWTRRTGRLRSAKALHEKALQIARNCQNDTLVANALLEIGTCHADLSDCVRAIGYFEKVSQLYRQLYADQPDWEALALERLANCLGDQGNFKDAIDTLRRVLALRRRVFEEERMEILLVYNSLYIAFSNLGRHDSAGFYSNRAFDLALKNVGKQHPVQMAIFYANRGANAHAQYLANRNAPDAPALRDTAFQLFEKAEMLYRFLGGKNQPLAEVRTNLAMFHLYERNEEPALEWVHKAYAANNYAPGNSPDSALSIYVLVRTIHAEAAGHLLRYEKYGEVSGLREGYRLCVQVAAALQLQRRNVSAQGSKDWLYRQFIAGRELNQRVARRLYELTDSIHYLYSAFDASEISKSQALAEAMVNEKARRFAGVPEHLQEREEQFAEDVVRLETHLAVLKSERPRRRAALAATQDSLLLLYQAQETLIAQFREIAPEYHDLRYGGQSTVSVQAVQERLLQAGQCLLEYFVGDSSVLIYVVKPGAFHLVEVEKDFPLEAWVVQLTQALGALGEENPHDSLYEASLRQFAEAASQLHEKLIDPVKNLILPDTDLIIIPDGVLGFVPFEALLAQKPQVVTSAKDWQFLIYDYKFSYCYSSTLLREMTERQHKQPPTDSLVAFAPFCSGDIFTRKSLPPVPSDPLEESFGIRFGRKSSDLPSLYELSKSCDEARQACQVWHGNYFLDTAATVQRFKNEAWRYRIVHLSTHGFGDPRVGGRSCLYFANGEELFVGDLYNLQLNADLVVLSACETAVGELQRGEGIISLSRAFAYAGAKSLVATLWRVESEATHDLMQVFYQKLEQPNVDKAKALRETKLEFLRSQPEVKMHPFFWASLIAVGDRAALR